MELVCLLVELVLRLLVHTDYYVLLLWSACHSLEVVVYGGIQYTVSHDEV